MERGQQERLAPMAREVAQEAGLEFRELTRIAATVGPGSFTGLRVGLAFAKGLRMALGCEAAAIGTLDGLAASVDADGLVAAVIDARRGQVYWRLFEAGRPLTEPQISPLPEAGDQMRKLADGRSVLAAGPGAHLLGDWPAVTAIRDVMAPDLAALARLASRARATCALQPLYLRAPDVRASAP